jgi:predicted SnoaL-like aldol condensation-catalyzing enzyme
MITQQFASPVRPAIASVSRRALVQRLGSAGIVAAAVAITPPVVRAQSATPTADLEANKALAQRFHEDIFIQGNLAAADEILTPDFTWYSPPQTVFAVGPEAVKQVATDFRAFIPDFVTTHDDVIAEGDRVVIRWTTKGTVQTDHRAVPVVYTGIDIFRIENGKLAELWQNTDDYGLAQQLGEIPTEATPATGTPAA